MASSGIWLRAGVGPFDMEGFVRAAIMKPVDGQYVHSPETRGSACEADGHRPDYVNLSVSGKVGKTVRMCHCGEYNEAPAALKEWKKKRRLEKAVAVENSQSDVAPTSNEAKT